MVQAQRGDSGGRRSTSVIWLLASLALAVGADAAESDRACAAWPGEPSPLPRIADPDPLRARWSALRLRELTRAAREAEADAPGRAHRLWAHALCLSPGDAEAKEGLERTPLVAIHRPPLRARAEASVGEDAWGGLGDPIAIRPRRGASPASPPSEAGTAGVDPDPMGRALEEVEEHLREARYEQALARAERGRGELDRRADPKRVARLEVLAATAALALERKQEAAASLRRALEADPMLTLDPMQTPPKVRRAFDRVRAGASL